jgi:ribosomal protein S18 acetylase RimI-like enzyme
VDLASQGICFRRAAAADAFAIAELMILAGGGMYEFLLEEMVPKALLAGLIAKSVKREEGGSSWRHCFVAERDGRIAGMINAYPAAWLESQDLTMLPPDRVAVLDPIDQVQQWQSYLISGIAVRHEDRRQGIARHLLECAIGRAEAEGFSRASLNVWADNRLARGFFAKQGFTLEKLVEVPEHPALGHAGGSMLLVRELVIAKVL